MVPTCCCKPFWRWTRNSPPDVFPKKLRMKYIFLCVALAGLLSCQPTRNTTSQGFYMPAEWEPHDAVWFGWTRQPAYHPIIARIMKTLTPHVPVKVAVASDSLLQSAKRYLYGQGVDSTRLTFYLMPGDRYWIRDHGAAFLVNDKGELGVADFDFDLYGYPGFLKLKYNNNPDSIRKYMALDINPKTARVDSLMAAAEGAKILKTNVIHEGGGIEVNGRGTLLLCESSVFQRNPTRTRQELEAEYKRVLGVSNIIWLKQGVADDPDGFFRRIVGNYVGGGVQHTDEFVRFSNPSTILLSWVDEAEKDLNPVNRLNYERMSENLRILEQATDQDGKPFTIVKVPMPDVIATPITVRAFERKSGRATTNGNSLDLRPGDFIPAEAPRIGDQLLRLPAASYMNYLVTNGLVLVATYVGEGSSKEKEARVKTIFEQQFPGRDIVFFDVTTINMIGGGGIHCSTHEQPTRKNVRN